MINYLGNISFSLYLYHWPVLIFYKYYKFTDLIIFEKVVCIIISVLISITSFKYIEQPFLRKNEIFSIKSFIPISFLVILSLSVINSNGWNFRLSTSEKNILTSLENQPGGICDKNQKIEKKSDCLYGDKNDLDIILVGDSHGKALFQGLKNFSKKYDKNLITYEDMCGSYPSYSEKSLKGKCSVDFKIPKTMIIGKKFYDYHLLKADLDKVSKQYLSSIIEVNNDPLFSNVKNIIIIGQVPEFFSSYGDLTSCFTRPYYLNKDKCNNFFNKMKFTNEKNINELLQNHNAKKKLNEYFKKNIKNFSNDKLKLTFFDPFEYFCSNKECIQVNENRLIYSDATHLSVYGSNFLIDKLDLKLKKLID